MLDLFSHCHHDRQMVTTTRLAWDDLRAHLAVSPENPTIPLISPIDQATLADIPQAQEADVDRAINRLRAAQKEWAAVSVAERSKVAMRLHSLVLDHQVQILDTIQHETGKSRRSAFDEVADVSMTALYYAKRAARQLAPQRRQGALPLLTTAKVHYQPRGVVAMITPWNYPFTLPISDAIPALLAGNAVMLKPDPKTPLTALLGIDLLVKAGLPKDLFLAVTGEASLVGEAMISRSDFVMFTGSTATGRIIAEQSSRRLIDFSAELGGKNPMIVLDDAPMERAIEGVISASFSNAGQLCMSIERLYVHEHIYEEFGRRLIDRVSHLSLGVGLNFTAEIGSLISRDQLERVKAHVEDAVSKGARVLIGGQHRSDLGGFIFEPTILEGVTEDMLLCRGETFGPVVSLTKFRDDDEVVALANDSDYGLNASVWGSPRRATRIATRIQAGSVNVNEGFTASWVSTDAPMGGMKHSGVGRRHGPEGIRKYAESQTVARQRAMNIDTPRGVSQEQFTKWMTRGLRMLKMVRR